MGLYRWNSGGQYRGKLWEQDLLADSQVCNDSVNFKPLQPPPGSLSEGSTGRRLAAGKRGKASNRGKARENV